MLLEAIKTEPIRGKDGIFCNASLEGEESYLAIHLGYLLSIHKNKTEHFSQNLIREVSKEHPTSLTVRQLTSFSNSFNQNTRSIKANCLPSWHRTILTYGTSFVKSILLFTVPLSSLYNHPFCLYNPIEISHIQRAEKSGNLCLNLAVYLKFNCVWLTFYLFHLFPSADLSSFSSCHGVSWQKVAQWDPGTMWQRNSYELSMNAFHSSGAYTDAPFGCPHICH